MNIAICDDQQQDLDLFLDLVNTYEQQNNKHITISTFSSGEAFLQHFQKDSYDAIFLDIYMTGITGIETAKAIRKLDEDVRLIFTTTSSDHFADGFSVEASHYLIKPLTTDKVNDAMHRLRNIFEKDETFLILPSGSKELRIPQSSILYIETIRNGIEIHCKQNSFSVRCPLSKALTQLDDRIFLHCHRYFIVNLDAVESLQENTFLLTNGKSILIRKNGLREIKETYHHFFMQRLRGDL